MWAATCVVNASLVVGRCAFFVGRISRSLKTLGFYTRAAMVLKKKVDSAIRTRSPLLLKLRVHQRAFIVITLIVLSYIFFWCIPLLASVAALVSMTRTHMPYCSHCVDAQCRRCRPRVPFNCTRPLRGPQLCIRSARLPSEAQGDCLLRENTANWRRFFAKVHSCQ